MRMYSKCTRLPRSILSCHKYTRSGGIASILNLTMFGVLTIIRQLLVCAIASSALRNSEACRLHPGTRKTRKSRDTITDDCKTGFIRSPSSSHQDPVRLGTTKRDLPHRFALPRLSELVRLPPTLGVEAQSARINAHSARPLARRFLPATVLRCTPQAGFST